MKKLQIVGRQNLEKKFVVKCKPSQDSMKSIMAISQSIRDHYFDDSYSLDRNVKHYSEWYDALLLLSSSDYEVDVLCGKKVLYMIWNKFPSLEAANRIIDQFCEWAEVKKDPAVEEQIKKL